MSCLWVSIFYEYVIQAWTTIILVYLFIVLIYIHLSFFVIRFDTFHFLITSSMNFFLSLLPLYCSIFVHIFFISHDFPKFHFFYYHCDFIFCYSFYLSLSLLYLTISSRSAFSLCFVNSWKYWEFLGLLYFLIMIHSFVFVF